MLRNNLHYFNCDYQRHVSREPVYINRRRLLVRYNDLGSLIRTAGSVEYCHFLVVICDSVGEIFNFVNKVFIRLHEATSLLLHWESTPMNDIKLLPDLLKDLSNPKIDKNNMEPDVISHTPKRCTIHRTRRVNSENRRASHSREDQRSYSHKCYSSSCSHHHQNINNSYHHPRSHSGDSGSNIFINHQDDPRNQIGRSELLSDQHYPGTNFYSPDGQVDISRLLDLENMFLHVAVHTDRIMNSQISVSYESDDQRNHDNCSGLSNQGLALACRVPSHGQSSGYEDGVSDTDTSREDVSKCTGDVQCGRQLNDLDREIVKDMVQTLRAVGDDLDARLSLANRHFLKDVLGALKINTWRFLLPTLNQYNLLGVAFEVSIAFLKLI